MSTFIWWSGVTTPELFPDEMGVWFGLAVRVAPKKTPYLMRSARLLGICMASSLRRCRELLRSSQGGGGLSCGSPIWCRSGSMSFCIRACA